MVSVSLLNLPRRKWLIKLCSKWNDGSNNWFTKQNRLHREWKKGVVLRQGSEREALLIMSDCYASET